MSPSYIMLWIILHTFLATIKILYRNLGKIKKYIKQNVTTIQKITNRFIQPTANGSIYRVFKRQKQGWLVPRQKISHRNSNLVIRNSEEHR